MFVNALNRLWKRMKYRKVIIAGSKKVTNMEDIRFPYDYVDWIYDNVKLAELYSDSIFVNTGLNEALPRPSYVAMACGATVITTNGCGAVEHAEDNKNCFEIKTGDADGLSRKLDFVLSFVESRRYIGNDAILTASKYNWHDVSKRITALFKREMKLS
ncbi:MAG: glycosyltransferase [Thermoplasmatales archaeon]